MTTFSPSSYLTSQGWAGNGHGLRKGSLKKPVTVAHKTNLKGIGKDRDTGYAWWDDVFSIVASKTASSSAASSVESNNTSRNNSREGSVATDLRKTSTGIFSARPPPAKSHSIVDTATPVNVKPSTNGYFNTDIIAQAKLEAARRELYSRFLRGKPLTGTADTDESDASEKVERCDASSSRVTIDVVDESQRRREKTERRAARAEKKARKEEKAVRKAAKVASTQHRLITGDENASQTTKEHHEPDSTADSATAGDLSDHHTAASPDKNTRKRKRNIDVVNADPPSDSLSQEVPVDPSHRLNTIKTDKSSSRKEAKRLRKEQGLG
ncbi:hypothetical protein EMMF5_006290 [Cystobasidiomycetes sp. EMM_F5]